MSTSREDIFAIKEIRQSAKVRESKFFLLYPFSVIYEHTYKM